ncbi:MAG: TonB-dependent receptor [Calditrichia bacterium]|nr:TonB-dependent receptor [Calditrichia bacterium]
MRNSFLYNFPKSIIIVFFLSSFIFSQNMVTVKGTIFDAQTMSRLSGANLIVEELGRGTTSDENGHFLLSSIPEGEFIISASYIGYRVFKQRLITKNTTEVSLTIMLMPTILEGQSIEVTTTRAVEGETPVTFSNVSREELSEKYTASDIPMMLDDLPGIYSYSHTGDNLGYSFLKIRGFDQSRVGVMLNEIPLNDPEDQQVYWVDHPDLTESVEDIQIQRGVGSSIYGTSTFGGSVNINTKNYSSERMIKVTLGGGSFNTFKLLAEYKSGLIDNTYGFYGRISRIVSDGYRKHSHSDLLAYFLGFERYDRNMVTRLNFINGHERTHPDWYGIPEDILKHDRRWKQETYKNAVDDFTQPIVQLINDWQISTRLNLINTLYLVHGDGYYENLKFTEDLTKFGMNYYETSDPTLFGSDSLLFYQTIDDSVLDRTPDGNYVIKNTDLTRQKFVDKNHYGWIGKLTYRGDEGLLTVGSSLYYFKSNHHGRVLWAKHIPYVYDPERNYYKYNGEKKSIALYANYLYDIYPDTKLLANFLYENKTYSFQQEETALFKGALINYYDVEYEFFSPRMGLNYTFSPELSIYGNVSYSQRDPSDNEHWDSWYGPDDLGVAPLFNTGDTVRSGGEVQYVQWTDPQVEPEAVVDYEMGITYSVPNFILKANLYFMDFSNEIVPLGGRNDDGEPIKGNADKTVHSGVELSVTYTPSNFFKLNGNLAWSENYYQQYIQQNYDGTTTDLSGNSIAGFPDFIGNLRCTGHWRNFRGSVFLKYLGKQYLDNTQNEERIVDPFSRIDLMFDYRLKNIFYFPEIRFIFKIINLLDKKYETAGSFDSWAEKAWFYPAAIRHYYFAVSFNL